MTFSLADKVPRLEHSIVFEKDSGLLNTKGLFIHRAVKSNKTLGCKIPDVEPACRIQRDAGNPADQSNTPIRRSPALRTGT